MRNVSAETHMSLCERKMWFAHAQDSKHDLKCEMFAIMGIGERNWIPSEIVLGQEENSPCCGFILPWLSGSFLARFPASFKSYGQDEKKPSFPNELFSNMYAHLVFLTATF